MVFSVLNRVRWNTAVLLGVFMLSGCAAIDRAPPMASDFGLIYLFPGVEGGPAVLGPVRSELRDAGVVAEIRIFDWGRIGGTLINLTAYESNRAKAADVAARIAEYHSDHPGRPIDLVGYSGGGGMVIMVAEALPADVELRNIVLVQPAISPTYDLTATLEHVRGRLVNFHSPLDWFILGAGTSVFGTMDRQYVESAGKGGFVLAAAVPREHQRHLVEQRPWTKDMADYGHTGNHLSMLMRAWNRVYVAPYLVDDCRTPHEASVEILALGD